MAEISGAVPRFSAYAFREPINWTVRDGEHWAVIGPNGSGKSQLISLLLGKQPLLSGIVRGKGGQSVNSLAKYVAFTDIYTIFDAGNSYYQQRWNTGDTQTAPFVGELFEGCRNETVERLMNVFNIRELLGKRVNMLSSGELRKTLIVLAIRSEPRILILDNPYIGLDAASRPVLDEMFGLLASECGIQLISLVCDPRDIPPVTTQVLPVCDKTLLPTMSPGEFYSSTDLRNRLFGEGCPPALPAQVADAKADFENILLFSKVTIGYGEKLILDRVDWNVKKGEKWLLSGKNGSGKSTLLSLVFCDNPQGYANDITLFDHKRGVGQSIWEVKRRIGYVSPDIINYYRKEVSCLDVVASGFSDTIGIPYSYDDDKRRVALRWMEVFGIAHLAGRSSLEVSAGEHQLAMLARAFVKDPDLMILDEPMHGLDVSNKARVRRIIEEWCTGQKSLIYVTHYEEEAPDVITNCLVLERANK